MPILVATLWSSSAVMNPHQVPQMPAMLRPSAVAGDARERDGTANGGLWQPERGVAWSCFHVRPGRLPAVRGRPSRPLVTPAQPQHRRAWTRAAHRSVNPDLAPIFEDPSNPRIAQ